MDRRKIATELLKIAKELSGAEKKTRMVLDEDDFRRGDIWRTLLDDLGIEHGEVGTGASDEWKDAPYSIDVEITLEDAFYR